MEIRNDRINRTIRWRHLAALVMVIAIPLGCRTAPEVVAAWDDDSGGHLRALSTRRPWKFTAPAVAIGKRSTLRMANGLVYAVSAIDGNIQVVDPRSWTVIRTYSLGTTSELRDIAAIDARRAYVARNPATHLLELDLATGATNDAVDLQTLTPGSTAQNMMHVDGNRLLVQLQSPPLVAVVDLTTERLIDCDPGAAGIQAIALAGTSPKLKMEAVDRTLFLSATGEFLDNGGLESVSLDRLRSNGLLIKESDGETGADLWAFTMMTPASGYLSFSTDLAPSSHLHRFSGGQVDPPELFVSVEYLAPVLLREPSANQLFVPVATVGAGGIDVFDAARARRLTRTSIPLPGKPSDLVLLARGSR